MKLETKADLLLVLASIIPDDAELSSLEQEKETIESGKWLDRGWVYEEPNGNVTLTIRYYSTASSSPCQ